MFLALHEINFSPTNAQLLEIDFLSSWQPTQYASVYTSILMCSCFSMSNLFQDNPWDTEGYDLRSPDAQLFDHVCIDLLHLQHN
jgi:hypothetical protein